MGHNEIKVRFVSSYIKDCQGLHYFKDPQDNEEYLYSQFEAADAHRVFPCFDQPDLKAPYSLLVYAPKDWVVLSTKAVKQVSSVDDLNFQQSNLRFKVNNELWGVFGEEEILAHEFHES